MTAADGLQHLLGQLAAIGADGIPGVADTVYALHAITDRMQADAEPSAGARGARWRAVTGRMADLRAGPGGARRRPAPDADLALPTRCSATPATRPRS